MTTNIDNINPNLYSPEQYEIDLINLDIGTNLILDNFKKMYVQVKMYPENQEIQQQFSNVISSLEEKLANKFTLSNDIQVSTDDISQKLLLLDILISREREKNTNLKRQLGMIEHKTNAASEMISNYKEIYDMRYLRNWALVLSSIACIYAISVVYKKQGV
jgi:hypothetical protein